jgi:Mg-chelatase subunit ChlD
MKSTIHNQRGAVIVIFALSLVVLIGFVAIGTEVGRWYHVRAELSKAVDAAAIAGAANISNTTIDVEALARDFGMENFQPGYLGTATEEGRSVSFTTTRPETGRISVTGRTTSVGVLSRLFGVEYVPTTASGLAQKNKVEIMMVLDRSGSMAGNPLSNLKTAARAFLGYYEDTQDEDRIGLVTFATGVSLRAPDINFFTPITSSINAMAATGATNAEDALAQAGAAFTDQTGVSAANRIQQFIVFFTDGRPTAFRSTFTRNGTNYDAVVCVTGNCNSSSDAIYDGPDSSHSGFGYHDLPERWYSTSIFPKCQTRDRYNNLINVPCPTGDGRTTGTTQCTNVRGLNGSIVPTIRWGSWPAYPVLTYGNEAYPAYCDLNNVYDFSDSRRPLDGGTTNWLTATQPYYICRTARQMAIAHASALKNNPNLGTNGVKIYTIGLGNVDEGLLSTISSGSGYAYVTPSSSELEAIFRSIAKQIKLRLVQ